MTHMLGCPHDQLVGEELFEIGLLKDEAAVPGVAEITYDERGLSWNLSAPVENALTLTQVGRG